MCPGRFSSFTAGIFGRVVVSWAAGATASSLYYFFVVFDTPYEVKKMLKYCDSSKHNFISLLSLFLSLLPSRTLNERRT